MKRCVNCFETYPDVFQVCPNCGDSVGCLSAAPGHLQPGTVLAKRYLIGPAAGSGGFGVLYRAFDTAIGRTVAVKEFFTPRLAGRESDGLSVMPLDSRCEAEFDFRKKRFLSEARFVSALGDARRFPSVTDFFEENGTAYIVMEYLSGRPLGSCVQKGGVQQDFALYVASELCRAVALLQRRGWIHRDISPDNVFLCSEGSGVAVRLLDFGAAVRAAAAGLPEDMICKNGFSAPELYGRNRIDKTADVYSLGATVYALLTGEKPTDAAARKKGTPLPPVRRFRPELPGYWDRILQKAMAMRPSQRYADADALEKAFLTAARKARVSLPEAQETKLPRRSGTENRDEVSDVTETRGVSQPVPDRLLPGTVVHGRYAVGLSRIRCGALFVYSGTDTVLKRNIYLAEFFPERLAVRDYDGIRVRPSNRDGAYEDCRALFLSGLEKFGNAGLRGSFETYTDTFEENNTVYLVSDRTEAVSLEEYLSLYGKKRLPEHRIRKILRPVAECLSEAAEKQLSHGNVTLRSVYTDGERTFLRFPSALSFPGSVLNGYRSGNPARVWSSPETAAGKERVLLQSDAYSLGALAYRMYTGSDPEDAMGRISCRVATGEDCLKPPEKFRAAGKSAFPAAVTAALSLTPTGRDALLKELMRE